jgi:hypothetical protein
MNELPTAGADVRGAHTWLRGYSDAKCGKPKLLECDQDYLRGYATGCGS